MSIDEKAFGKAIESNALSGHRLSLLEFVQSYEAAKSSEQPDECADAFKIAYGAAFDFNDYFFNGLCFEGKDGDYAPSVNGCWIPFKKGWDMFTPKREVSGEWPVYVVYRNRGETGTCAYVEKYDADKAVQGYKDVGYENAHHIFYALVRSNQIEDGVTK